MTKTIAQQNRIDAELKGALFYNGRPCSKGHTMRYTKTKQCRECEIERLKIRKLRYL
jgi:hypothetical protein